MSAVEIKQRLTDFINTKDEDTLARLWGVAESILSEEDVTYEHETPEFFAELDLMDADIDAGRERTYTREEMNEMLRRRTAV